MNENIICEGAWVIENESTGEDVDVECPLRKTCYRYMARHRLSKPINYFDVVPMSIKGDCNYFIDWS